MNFYSILHNSEKSNQDDEWIALSSSFSFQAFIFGIFWLFYHNMWKVFLLFIMYATLIGYLENIKFFNDVQVTLFSLITSLYLGLEGSELKSKYLQSKGYALKDIVYAASEEDALLKHYYKIEN